MISQAHQSYLRHLQTTGLQPNHLIQFFGQVPPLNNPSLASFLSHHKTGPSSLPKFSEVSMSLPFPPATRRQERAPPYSPAQGAKFSSAHTQMTQTPKVLAMDGQNLSNSLPE